MVFPICTDGMLSHGRMRETLVFAGEGRCSDLSDREAAIQAAIGRQKAGKPLRAPG